MPPRPCTADGHHNVTSLDLRGNTEPCGSNGADGGGREGRDENGAGGGGGASAAAGFQEVFIRCNQDHQVEFVQDCSGVVKTSVFNCLGGWEVEVPYDSLPSEGQASFSFGGGGGGGYDSGYDSFGGGGGGYEAYNTLITDEVITQPFLTCKFLT